MKLIIFEFKSWTCCPSVRRRHHIYLHEISAISQEDSGLDFIKLKCSINMKCPHKWNIDAETVSAQYFTHSGCIDLWLWNNAFLMKCFLWSSWNIFCCLSHFDDHTRRNTICLQTSWSSASHRRQLFRPRTCYPEHMSVVFSHMQVRACKTTSLSFSPLFPSHRVWQYTLSARIA